MRKKSSGSGAGGGIAADGGIDVDDGFSVGSGCDNAMSAREVQKWFARSVKYEGEPYTIDLEQAAAVANASKNTIVVARAGSGKTRTIVAKITYLIAKCGVDPDEIMAFVFNANAAAEINARLAKMQVDGGVIVEKPKIASTFHAFSRKIVYDVCNGREKCKNILANEKEKYMFAIVMRMLCDEKWREMIIRFVKGGGGDVDSGDNGGAGCSAGGSADGAVCSIAVGASDNNNSSSGNIRNNDDSCDESAISASSVSKRENSVDDDKITELELMHFAKMMSLFVNRAQQKFLGGDVTLGKSARRYLKNAEIDGRERAFVKLGVECYRRYHWLLLDENKRKNMNLYGSTLGEYGTDFNLIVSWAAKLIFAGNDNVRRLLGNKKYILIDEYQDFSQLFLSVVMAIRKIVPEAKIFVVGDDWQAINRFAGSDVEYFKEFEKFFPEDTCRLEISTNYRCDYRIVDTARKFMEKSMKEAGGFRAASKRAGKVVVVDPKMVEIGYALVDYDMRVSSEDRIYIQMAQKIVGKAPKRRVVQYFKVLAELIGKNKKYESILILHRNNETNLSGASLMRIGNGLRWGLNRLGIMKQAEFDEKVRIMTMHKSKGLESDVVIILEADSGVIPKSHPDTRLYGVFGETEEVALDDQKRLFYVAMTRAKRRLYIMHDGPNKGEESGFIRFLGRNVEKG